MKNCRDQRVKEGAWCLTLLQKVSKICPNWILSTKGCKERVLKPEKCFQLFLRPLEGFSRPSKKRVEFLTGFRSLKNHPKPSTKIFSWPKAEYSPDVAPESWVMKVEKEAKTKIWEAVKTAFSLTHKADSKPSEITSPNIPEGPTDQRASSTLNLPRCLRTATTALTRNWASKQQRRKVRWSGKFGKTSTKTFQRISWTLSVPP